MKKKAVLSDHKREGKRLIPPLLQLPNVVATSFIDDRLPDLIWMSTIFRQAHPKVAVDLIIDFVNLCSDIVGTENTESLGFLTNVGALSTEQKTTILSKLEGTFMLEILRKILSHQNAVLVRYPLAFIYPQRHLNGSREDAIAELKQDVDLLLDRYSSHATKVQVTALVAMMATGKIKVSSEINLPNFDLIFTDPESDGARRAASFARATLNSDMGFMIPDQLENSSKYIKWTLDFWAQAYLLDGCK